MTVKRYAEPNEIRRYSGQRVTCWLCFRTSPQKILEASHKLFPDPELAHKIGMKAAELLREAYLAEPPALCGKKTNALIAGALYVASLLEDEWVTQREVAEVCDITETSVRYNYRHLIKALGLEDKLLVKHQYGWGETATETYYPRIPQPRRGPKL